MPAAHALPDAVLVLQQRHTLPRAHSLIRMISILTVTQRLCMISMCKFAASQLHVKSIVLNSCATAQGHWKATTCAVAVCLGCCSSLLIIVQGMDIYYHVVDFLQPGL